MPLAIRNRVIDDGRIIERARVIDDDRIIERASDTLAAVGYSGHAGAGEDAPSAEPASGEARHLTSDEQGVLHRALRKSATIVHKATAPPSGSGERPLKRDPGQIAMITEAQLDAALRQRADEAREECVRIVYDEAHYEEETAKRIVAAIRARIAPP